MKNIFCLSIFIFLSFSSSSQIRKIGTAADSISFTSILIAPDSSIYFVGSKGGQQILIVKTNRQLDTLWSRTISMNRPSGFPSTVYLNQSNEILINCADNLMVKMDSSGTALSIKEISLPGATSFSVMRTLVINDSLLFTVNSTETTGQHNGIAVADTAGNIIDFHDYGVRPMDKIMKFNGGYFLSPASVLVDSGFNIIHEYYTTSLSGVYTFESREASVLNDTTIVGSILVTDTVNQTWEEIFCITRNGLEWIVKGYLNSTSPTYQVTPAKNYSNGIILFLFINSGRFYIGAITSNGLPYVANYLYTSPDYFTGKIVSCDLSDKIGYAYGNVFGIADTFGASCFSATVNLAQRPTVALIGDSGIVPDSTYLLNCTITSVMDSVEQVNFAIDAICDPVGLEGLSFENNIVIYPNPWRDNFQISGLTPSMSKLTITDISGKIVFENAVKNGEQIIVPEFLSSGFYFVKIDSASKPIPTIKVD